MHYGHQRCSCIWETEVDAGVADVVEHARDTLAERCREKGREDNAGSESGRGRWSVGSHVSVRRHVLAIRRQDRSGFGHQTRFLQRRDAKKFVQYTVGTDQFEYCSNYQHERCSDTTATRRRASKIQREKGSRNVLLI